MPDDASTDDVKQTVAGVQESGISALPYLVVKITGRKRDAPQAVSYGTGFFYRMDAEGIQVPLIVTNKHVVDNLDILCCHFGLMDDHGKRILGKPEVVCFDTSQVPILRHPNPDVDIAAIPANPLIDALAEKGKKPFHLYLSKDALPPNWLSPKLVASTGILMVGFPNGLIDEANNLPLTRKGILSTPYTADYNGKPNFVVDIAAFGGSSGSPVFAHYDGSVPTEKGATMLGGQAIYFLGVLHSGPTVSAFGDVITKPIPMAEQISHTSLMMHLGYCVRAVLIEDLVPEVQKVIESEQSRLTSQPLA